MLRRSNIVEPTVLSFIKLNFDFSYFYVLVCWTEGEQQLIISRESIAIHEMSTGSRCEFNLLFGVTGSWLCFGMK